MKHRFIISNKIADISVMGKALELFDKFLIVWFVHFEVSKLIKTFYSLEALSHKVLIHFL